MLNTAQAEDGAGTTRQVIGQPAVPGLGRKRAQSGLRRQHPSNGHTIVRVTLTLIIFASATAPVRPRATTAAAHTTGATTRRAQHRRRRAPRDGRRSTMGPCPDTTESKQLRTGGNAAEEAKRGRARRQSGGRSRAPGRRGGRSVSRPSRHPDATAATPDPDRRQLHGHCQRKLSTNPQIPTEYSMWIGLAEMGEVSCADSATSPWKPQSAFPRLGSEITNRHHRPAIRRRVVHHGPYHCPCLPASGTHCATTYSPCRQPADDYGAAGPSGAAAALGGCRGIGHDRRGHCRPGLFWWRARGPPDGRRLCV